MINWFKKRKTNKEIEKFERILSDKLGELYPDMKELRDNTRYLHSNFTVKPQGLAFVIQLTDHITKDKVKNIESILSLTVLK